MNETETVLDGSIDAHKSFFNLGNIVLQPESIENAYKNHDDTITYLVRWKSIWLHETLCMNFTDLIEDYWRRQQQHNEGETTQQPLTQEQTPSDLPSEVNNALLTPSLKTAEPIISVGATDNETVNNDTEIANTLSTHAVVKDAPLLDDVDKIDFNSSADEKLYKQIIINLPSNGENVGENYPIDRQVFQALDNQGLNDMNMSVNMEEDAVSTRRRFNVDSTSSDVETTLKRRHDGTLSTPTSTQQQEETIDSKNKVGTVACDICQKTLSSKNTLREHRILVHLKNGNFPCDQCAKRFTHRRALQIHKVIHSNERSHVCDKCGSSHKRERELRRHMLDMHEHRQTYRCDVCFICFKAKADLKDHCFSEHKFTITTCIVCKHKLSTPFSIYSHNLSHAHIKEFKCVDCGKELSSKTALKHHMNTHDPDRKPYKICEKCNKTFFSRSHFYEHQLTHEEDSVKASLFKCEQCDVSFQHSSSLKRHMIRHRPGGDLEHPKVNPYLNMDESELPRYCCRKCRKNFTSSSGYYDHIKRCGAETVEVCCQICGRKYSSRKSVNRHIRNAHAAELDAATRTEEEIEAEIEAEDIAVQIIALAPALQEEQDLANKRTSSEDISEVKNAVAEIDEEEEEELELD